MKKTFTILFFCAFQMVHAKTIFVKASATGANNGTNWTDAFIDLQLALDAAEAGDQIRVAQGTYKPTAKTEGNDIGNRAFLFNKDIVILGSFPGIPGGENEVEDRDINLFPTILDGSGETDNIADDSYHVVVMKNLSLAFGLDGVIIQNGNNTHVGGLNGLGAGISIIATASACSPRMVNCIIKNNISGESGGGVSIGAGSGGTCNAFFFRCKFFSNEGSGGGGIDLYTDTDSNVDFKLTNCEFRGNTARTAQGGALSIIAHSSKPKITLINCLLSGNKAEFSNAISTFSTGNGGVEINIHNSTITHNASGSIGIVDLGEKNSALKIRNSILWQNGNNHGIRAPDAKTDIANSCLQFFPFLEPGNVNENPAYVDVPTVVAPHIEGDFHLTKDSPLIDAGENSEVPNGIVFDLDINSRFFDSKGDPTGNSPVDMGAYEFQDIISSSSELNRLIEMQLSPNPVNSTLIIQQPLQNATAQILDMNGKIVSIFNINDQLDYKDVSALNAGMYMLVVKQSNNVVRSKFLKI